VQNGGLVKIVVGKTFEEIVMDDTKDVFLYVMLTFLLTAHIIIVACSICCIHRQ
jgi:Na+/H+ antiporter NhaC